MKTRHPWQLFPGQLIQYALDHLHRSSEFDQIVGFLLLDVGVETLFKVFLLLPEETTKTDMPYGARKKATEGSFHDLVRGVETAAKTAGDRLKGIDLGHVQYFHGLRNKLYHAGNGITVQGKHAEQYASTALDLLDRLLGVPLKDTLEDQVRSQEESEKLAEQLDHIRASLRRKMQVLERELRLTVETIEPAFLMPSFEIVLEEWRSENLAFKLMRDPRFFSVVTSSEIGSDPPYEFDSLRVTEDKVETKMYKRQELLGLMPPSLSGFVDEHGVETATAAKLLMSSDLTEFLLIVASIALQLPTDSFINTYTRVQLLLVTTPLSYPEARMARLLDEGNLLMREVGEICKALTVSMSQSAKV
jgi:hypothetical protein